MKRYKTADIGLAAVIILYGYDLAALEPTRKKNGIQSDIFHFVFEAETDDNKPDIDKIIFGYSSSNNEIQVRPKDFLATVRILKEKTRNYCEG